MTKKILFVCLGNICRSPSAQGICEHLAKKMGMDGEILFDSAGTHGYHIGKPPDARAIAACALRAVDISAQRARQFSLQDVENFDHIITLDQRNLAFIMELAERQSLEISSDQVHCIARYIPSHNEGNGIKDPFHGTEEDFNTMVLELFDVCQRLLTELTPPYVRHQ